MREKVNWGFYVWYEAASSQSEQTHARKPASSAHKRLVFLSDVAGDLPNLKVEFLSN